MNSSSKQGWVWGKLALHVLAIVVLDVAESSIVKANAGLRRAKNLMGLAAHLRWSAEEFGRREDREEAPVDPLDASPHNDVDDEATAHEGDAPPNVPWAVEPGDVPLPHGFPFDDTDEVPPPSGVRHVAGNDVVCG
jgi:hypothetical protein